MKKQAKAEAEADAKRIIADAETYSAQLKSEAKNVIASEINTARMAIRKEIVDSVKENVLAKFNNELTDEQKLILAQKNLTKISSNEQNA